MPIQIPDLQRRALIFIVDEAKGREWVVPTATELATHLYGIEEPEAAVITKAQHVIDRLQKNYRCFLQKKNPKRRVVDRKALVTDPSSAHYVLTLRQLCRAHPNRCTTKEELHQRLANELPQVYSQAGMEQKFKHALQGKYIVEGNDDNLPAGQIRQGLRVEQLFPYLQELGNRPKL